MPLVPLQLVARGRRRTRSPSAGSPMVSCILFSARSSSTTRFSAATARRVRSSRRSGCCGRPRLHEFPTRSTKLSQYCHGCRAYAKKPLNQRFHECACGIGPVQRDLYSAFLAAYLDPPDYLPSSAQYQWYWEGADLRLRAALERLQQRAKEGQVLPRSVGITGAGARLPESLVTNRQGLVSLVGRPEELG